MPSIIGKLKGMVGAGRHLPSVATRGHGRTKVGEACAGIERSGTTKAGIKKRRALAPKARRISLLEQRLRKADFIKYGDWGLPGPVLGPVFDDVLMSGCDDWFEVEVTAPTEPEDVEHEYRNVDMVDIDDVLKSLAMRLEQEEAARQTASARPQLLPRRLRMSVASFSAALMGSSRVARSLHLPTPFDIPRAQLIW